MKELLRFGCEVHVVTGVEEGKRVESFQEVKIHQYDLAPVDLSDL